MPITVDHEEVGRCALELLAMVGAFLDDPDALTDAVTPPYDVDTVATAAVSILAALVSYQGMTGDDLVEVGTFFAVRNDLPTTTTGDNSE